jgi:hypothetical protein
VGDWTEAWDKGAAGDQGDSEQEEEEEGRRTWIDVDTIECRIGKKLYQIRLHEE